MQLRLSDLNPLERAQFATVARIFSCLVTESLVLAFYQPIRNPEIAGLAIILAGDNPSTEILNLNHILGIVPLHHPPIFKDDEIRSLGRAIGLLDPLDMIPLAFIIDPKQRTIEVDHIDVISNILKFIESTAVLQLDQRVVRRLDDPICLWNKFADMYNLDEHIKQDIAEEFANSVKWQTHSYEHPAEAPAFSSPSIQWEQSIVEGHPIHPMHKLRRFLPPLPDHAPGTYDLLRPNLRFVSVPRVATKIVSDFEKFISPLVKAAEARAGKPLAVEDDRVLIPVHELQTMHIKEKFPAARIYPPEYSIPLLAQQGIRSVVFPGFHGLHLKLPLGVKVTSAVRTISPESAYLGPRFSAKVVPALTMDHRIITVARELASIIHSDPNGDIAKHCAALVRECHEDTSEAKGERLIVCTSLVECGHSGTDGVTSSVVRVFDLDSEEKRLRWFETFVSIFLRAFLPPMIHNGVAFECHPQNCVARFDLSTKELKGFVIRDFGGLRIHPPTLKATTGVDLDFFISGHSVIAETLEDVYTRMYHTMFHNHLQRLIRVLGLHYNGLGWEIVRDQLKKNIPSDHPLCDMWLSPLRTTFPGKAFLRMRMSSMYRFHLHAPFPNLILYAGSGDLETHDQQRS